MVGLGTLCHHTAIEMLLTVPCAVYYIPVTSFYNQKFRLLISFIYFIHAHILSPQMITSLFSVSTSLCFVLFVFIFKFQI